MTKEQWKTELEKQIKFDSEYIPSFQTTLTILSEILEERDRVRDEYINSGARPVIEFTSDRGAKNPKSNPLLKQWQELNTTALAYLRDLGLTAAGLRKLQGQLPKKGNHELDKLDRLRLGLDDDDDDENEPLPPEYWAKVKQEVEEKANTTEANGE